MAFFKEEQERPGIDLGSEDHLALSAGSVGGNNVHEASMLLTHSISQCLSLLYSTIGTI